MKTIIKNKNSFSKNDNLIILYEKISDLNQLNISSIELKYIKQEIHKNKQIITINQYSRLLIILNVEKNKIQSKYFELLRKKGAEIQSILKSYPSLFILNENKKKSKEILSIAEGISLKNYCFDRHKSTKDKSLLKTVYLQNVAKKETAELQNIINAVFLTKDLINEPFSHLKAQDLANEAKKIAKKYKLEITVYNKRKIQSLKMGGLLAVNQGSIDEPTFTILEWKPKNVKNKKPIVLVGKGIVYDTGGLSLKTTSNSMDLMKIDMGGAGTIIGAMQAIAANKIDKHVIALLPATDNRPSGNAYAPGDVIKMYDGTTVEVLNTDAEGRLILADALSFAKKYNPELVIDLATLTGSAVAAIGNYGSVSMHENAEKQHAELKNTGELVNERLAEFPFWDDYNSLLDSEIADIKNIGGPYAGAITAGKFLANFINYPWIHIDLSAVYSKTNYGYIGKGATGFGVRLLYYFIKNK